MTKYDFTKKRNMTIYYKLKKKKRANKKENNNPRAR